MRTAIRLTDHRRTARADLACADGHRRSINPDVVKGTPLFEGYGAGTHIGSRRLFAWSNEVRAGSAPISPPSSKTNGGTLTRMNASRTSAYVGGFDQGTDRVVFQQVARGRVDLFLFDIERRSRGVPLKRLNDGHWQWNPSIDTHRGTTWIVYGVNRFGSPAAKWRLFLFNGATGERTLLDETTNRCGCLFPGTIAYPWVTWAVGEDATAWRYDIRTGERSPCCRPTATSTASRSLPSGTAYVAEGGDRCGSRTRPSTGWIPTARPYLVHAFADGREAANLSVDFIGPHDRLYFDRRACRNELVRHPAAASRGRASASPARPDARRRAGTRGHSGGREPARARRLERADLLLVPQRQADVVEALDAGASA